MSMEKQMTTAHDILAAAQGHMQDRAATYDKPEGERSIGAAVKAFNAVTGDGEMNSEERGWLFMAILKMVRSQQGNYHADNYEDLSAYGALMGEAAARDRGKPVTQELHSEGWKKGAIAAAQAAIAAAQQPYHDAALHGHELYTEEDEKRMDIIGSNGNDGTHYRTLTLPEGERYGAEQ